VKISVVAHGVELMLVLDVTVPPDVLEVAADVSTGVLESFAGQAVYAGRSLVSGHAITLTFRGGSPAAAAYRAATVGLPPATVEQFDITRIFEFD
jgi:hypothetical protein